MGIGAKGHKGITRDVIEDGDKWLDVTHRRGMGCLQN